VSWWVSPWLGSMMREANLKMVKLEVGHKKRSRRREMKQLKKREKLWVGRNKKIPNST
jgi:hypothetical protein